MKICPAGKRKSSTKKKTARAAAGPWARCTRACQRCAWPGRWWAEICCWPAGLENGSHEPEKKKNADRGVDHLLLRSAYGNERRPAGADQRGRQEAGWRRGWARRGSPRPGDVVPTAGTPLARRPRARPCGRAATSGAREADGADQGEARGPRGRRNRILHAAPHPSVTLPSAEWGSGSLLLKPLGFRLWEANRAPTSSFLRELK